MPLTAPLIRQSFPCSGTWSLSPYSLEPTTTAQLPEILTYYKVIPYTYTRYLPHLIGTKTALDQISERFVKLVNTMQNSNNPKVTNIVQVCKNTASSIISMNSDFISKHLGVERTAVWDLNKVKSTRKGLTEGDQTTVEIIKEVLNGKCNISVLSREEVRDLLDYLCIG